MQHDVQRLCNAGSALAQRGLYKDSYAFYEKALEAADSAVETAALIRFNYGLALYAGARYEDAAVQLETAVALAPGDDDCVDALALALQKSGKIDRAESLFLTVTERNPRCGKSWNNLGVLYFEQGDLSRARSCFETALSCNDRDGDALFNLRDTCAELGDDKAAAQYTARMRKLGISE